VSEFRRVQLKRQASIFYVEDDPILARVLKWRLETLGYIICGSASTGEEAIEKIPGAKPDLVLLDIELGGEMDGIDVGEFLSKQTRIPFIYLTSHADGLTLLRAKIWSPEGYIKKPVDEEQLRISIEMALHS
jgi:CheY-like chemotaxis protein